MILRPAILILLAALTLSGGRAAAQARQPRSILTNERLIVMLRNGTSEGTILSLIEKFPDDLDGGPDALVKLRKAGAGNSILLAVRRAGLARQAAREEAAAEAAQPPQAPAAEPQEDGGAGADAQEEPDAAPARSLFEDGRLSLGLGYPFLAVKYDFSAYAAEVRYLGRRGIQVYSARGYWNFYARRPWTAYTGLEAGYVRFAHGSGSGEELAGFIGGACELDKDIFLSADVAPTLVLWPGGGRRFGIGDLGWYVNIGVFFRLPAAKPRSEIENEDRRAEAAAEEEESEFALKRDEAPARRSSYEDRLAAAAGYVSSGEYGPAGQEYARAAAGLPENDGRRVFLYERRGWLAQKTGDYRKARDLYMAAVAAARKAAVYDSATVNAYAGLAYCFEKLDNIPLAIRNYERALDLTDSQGVRNRIEKALRRLRASAPPQDE